MRNWTNSRGSCLEYIFISQQRTVKRMDPWEHEDRSNFGGVSQSPSRPLRNRDHDRLFIFGVGTCSWAMIVNGINKNLTEMTEFRAQTKCVYGTSHCMHSHQNRDLSDSWTGFTRFTILEDKLPDVYTWSGVRFTKKHTTSRLDYLWPEV